MLDLQPHARPAGRPCTHVKYLLTCDEFEDVRAIARDLCQICDKPAGEEPSGALRIDHDPLLGWWAVRGLLCNRCNSGLPYERLAGPRTDAYLAGPWYARRLAEAGITLSGTEPKNSAPWDTAGPDHASALAALEAAAAAFAATQAAFEAAQKRKVASVVAGLKVGIGPSAVARRAHVTDAYVRSIARAHGIPPAHPGPKKRAKA